MVGRYYRIARRLEQRAALLARPFIKASSLREADYTRASRYFAYFGHYDADFALPAQHGHGAFKARYHHFRLPA